MRLGRADSLALRHGDWEALHLAGGGAPPGGDVPTLLQGHPVVWLLVHLPAG